MRDSPHGPTGPRPTHWGLTVDGRAPLIALVGNPNTGKTSLFNALTGFHRHVANYPGVTVEVARGLIRGGPRQIELLDLPGTYSLNAQSPDEAVVGAVLSGAKVTGPAPVAILAVVDACNLRRNLFLVSQLRTLGPPVVVAVNMMDIARRRGLAIDVQTLALELGCTVVPVVATDPGTLEPLRRALEQSLQARGGDDGAMTGTASAEPGVDSADAAQRFARIDAVLSRVLSRTQPQRPTWSERFDEVLTHRWLALPILLAVLFIVFQALFTLAAPLSGALEIGLNAAADRLKAALPAGPVQSALTDGVLGGVGAVLTFVPQIALLFALIAILEDCGYMARAAFMLDRTMRVAGLSGRSFIPLMSAFACAVPAIMGARSIPDRRERFVTILLAPFMSCSARLPVYALLIGAFVPDRRVLGSWLGVQGLTMFGMYCVGAVCALPVAWLLRRTVFCGPPPAFVMELPSYKRPRLRAVWQRCGQAVREFLWRAGTVIFLVNFLVWMLGYFPRSAQVAARVRAEAVSSGWTAEQADHVLQSSLLENSYLGRIGHAIEPMVRPLGWDWRIGVAVLASFPAREVVIGTLGTLFRLGGEESEESPRLREMLATARHPDTGLPLITLPVALSLMVFFALCAQCASTLITLGQEMHSWIWPVVSFVGMTLIAYAAAFATLRIAAAILE